MKQFLLLLTCIIFFAGCEKNDSPFQSNTFEINIERVNDISVEYTIIPSSKTDTYYYGVVNEDLFLEKYKSDIKSYLDEKINNPKWQGYTIEGIIARISSTGNVSGSFKELSPETSYIVFAVGVSDNGVLTTELTFKKFTTLKFGYIDTQFKINVLESEWDNVNFEILPSDDNTEYYVTVKPFIFTKVFTDEELLNNILEYGFIRNLKNWKIDFYPRRRYFC